MSDADLRELREQVCWANRMLPAAGLVTMHSGNASGLLRLARVPLIVLLLHRLAAHLHPPVIRRVSHPLLLPSLSSHAFAR